MQGGGSVRGRRDGHCIGRYAPYWNAFLLEICSMRIAGNLAVSETGRTGISRCNVGLKCAELLLLS